MKLNEEHIRLIMYRKSISQTDVAGSSGVARPTISAICNGKSCRPETAQKIADALGVQLEEIAR